MKKTIAIIAVNTALVVLGFLLYHKFLLPESAYVDSRKLFNEFTMKKQLEQEYKTIENGRMAELDSIELRLRMMSNELDRSNKELMYQFQLHRKNFDDKKNEYLQLNEMLSGKYNEQIWTRINQYVKDYGDKHNYGYIYGLTGDGAIMYAKEKEDITADVLNYINKSYEGIQQ
jgi:outer membrane protein